MKQLNNKKFTVTVISFQKESKGLQNGQYCLVPKTTGARFWKTAQHFLSQTTEEVRGEIRKFSALFSPFYSYVKHFFSQCTDTIFSRQTFKALYNSISPETVNIKKLANLTASTKNHG